MSIFTVNIAISATDLSTINLAGESLTIVLGVTALVTSAAKIQSTQPVLVWLAFAPLESNVISFTDASFMIYAASNMPAAGAVVQVGSQAAAVAGMVQPFQPDGTFGQPQSAQIGPNTFAVNNAYVAATGYMVFGISLAATLNGQAIAATPLIARVTPNAQQAQFSPNYGLQVFLQSDTENAMVLPNSISSLPVFQLSAGQATLNLQYNAKIGGFQSLGAKF